MNRFYSFPQKTQWFWSIVFSVIFLGLCLFWMYLMTVSIVWILLIFVLVPLQHLLLTSWMRLAGVYEYLSPMLLVFSPNKKEYDLHNGTSFDYLWVMRGVKAGSPLRNKLLAYYFQGLSEIIDRIERGTLPPSILVKGSSYFFSERTTKRLGFDILKTNSSVRLNIILNYLDLIWMYSLSRGKLSFPKLGGIKTAQITGENLLLQKALIERYKDYFSRYI